MAEHRHALRRPAAATGAGLDRAGRDGGRRAGRPFASLDADPDLFGSFIAGLPAITVADLRWLRPYTFNLNPALQGQVFKAVARKATDATVA